MVQAADLGYGGHLALPCLTTRSSGTRTYVTYSRDKLGRVTTLSDPAGMETTSAYDLLGRKTEEVRDAAQGGLAIKTAWEYDQWDGMAAGSAGPSRSPEPLSLR